MKLLVKPIFILGLIIFLLGLTINLSYSQTKEIVIDPEEVIGKYVTDDPEEHLDIKKDGRFFLKEKGKYYEMFEVMAEITGKWEIEKDEIIFVDPLGFVTRGKIEPSVIVIIGEEEKIWFKEGSIPQTIIEIVIDPEEAIGKYVTGNPEEYLDIKKDGRFYLKKKGKYYSMVAPHDEAPGKWRIEKDKIIFFYSSLGLETRGKIKPNIIIDEEGIIWFKEGSISQEEPVLISPHIQCIKESIAHRIQRLKPLLSEGPPVRERDWVTRQLDKLTGAEWVIDNAIWLFELAQEQWQEARDFLAEADLENAQRRVIYAEATLLNAYTTLSAAYGVVDEGLARAERVGWYYLKGVHESEKLVALFGFGPKGYEVASKLCLLDDFVVEGLTQGWEGASKALAFRLVLDKLIDASGILKDIAVSDKVVYDNLRTALSGGEFMRTLITEFAAQELVTEGIKKVAQSTLSWLEKHRGSFVDIDLGSGLTEEKFPVLPREMIEVNLYFPDSQAMYLVSEKRKIPQTTSLAKQVVIELIKGPTSSSLYPTIPQGTSINEVYIAGDIAYIDLSEEVFKNHPGGIGGELMTVYSIVNSLTEISPIKGVQILVEGNERNSLVGHVDISMPLLRDEDWIKP